MNYNFIKDRDLILFSFQPWDTDIGSNFKDMALELSKYNRVLYVNRALDRAFLWKHENDPQVKARMVSIRKGEGEITQVAPNLWVQNPRTLLESINWIPSAIVHDRLNKMNNRRLAREINKVSGQLGFSDVILINDNDFIRGRYLKEYVECSSYIFYVRDYMLGVSYFQRHGGRLEAGTMRSADLVVANSTYLANYAKKYNPNSYDIGQGCDLTNYTIKNPEVPADLVNLKRPVIGYVGYISSWRIDVGVVQYLAEQLPDCSIVLVGPDDLMQEGEKLKRISNLHLTGGKPQQTLSNYIYYFDVCINPQVLNDITRGNYPRKVDEYLAMGKPVVATRTEAMKLFEPYSFLCDTREDYIKSIRYIINNPEKTMSASEKTRRMNFAFSHTWEDSIGRLGNAYHSVNQKIRSNGRTAR